jgi:hypothetical protein
MRDQWKARCESSPKHSWFLGILAIINVQADWHLPRTSTSAPVAFSTWKRRQCSSSCGGGWPTPECLYCLNVTRDLQPLFGQVEELLFKVRVVGLRRYLGAAVGTNATLYGITRHGPIIRPRALLVEQLRRYLRPRQGLADELMLAPIKRRGSRAGMEARTWPSRPFWLAPVFPTPSNELADCSTAPTGKVGGIAAGNGTLLFTPASGHCR